MHRAAFGIQHPAVREHIGVGRHALDPHADHEGGVEPAAMLVRSLEIDDASALPRALPVGGELRVGDLRRAVRGPRVEPHVEDVALFAERAARLAGWAGEPLVHETLDRQLEPGVGAALARERGGTLDHPAIEEGLAAALAVERGNAHAPRALARQTPVRPRAHRFTDAIARALGLPAHLAFDRFERAVTVAAMIHDHEPLTRGAEDHRLAAAPAVRVGVGEARAREQAAVLPEPIHDVVVHLEHAAAGERSGLGGEAPRFVHRTERLPAFPLAHGEVLLAVTGRGVDQPGAFLEAHVRHAVDDQ